MVIFCAAASAQTTTTFTGTIKDLTGAAATSGQVTFTLQPGADTTISGSARFTPQTINCGINGSGAVLNQALSGACILTNNTALTPAGTSYLVQLCPYFACIAKFVTYAIGGTVDITQSVPTPSTLPAYSIMDLFSTQTISGVKTFTGADIFTSPVTAGTINLLRTVDGVKFTTVQAAVSDACGAGGGTVYIPAGTYTQSGAMTTCSNLHIYCEGNDKSVIAFAPSSTLNDALIINTSSKIEIEGCKITGNANTVRLVSITAGSNIKIHDNTITGAGLAGSGPLAGIYINQSSDVWVERNVMANGPSVANAASNSEIMTWTGAGGSSRIHIRSNTVTSAGLTTIPIVAFDCVDCDILNNQVNQNNIYSGGGNNGYGIACYLSTLSVAPRMRIEGNNVTNAAGSGIYLQTCDKAVVSGNTINNVAQQQTDVSIPAAGISVNRCDSCAVTSNNIDTSGKDGIAFADVGSHNVFSNNNILNISQYGIDIRGTSSDNTFSDNNIWTITNEGIIIASAATQTRANISGNTIATTQRTPIELLGACVSCNISRNIISAFHTGFFAITSANASTSWTKIDGNLIDNASNGSLGGGIDLNLGSNYSVNGNSIRNLTTEGILAEAGVADSLISGNMVKGVSGIGILTSSATRSQIINNKLLSNGTQLTTAATDMVWGNGLDAAAPFAATTGLTVGGGSLVNKILNGSATLTYTAISAQTGQEQTLTITGASTTNFGVYCAPLVTLGNANLGWSAWVSASNTVSVRVVNPTVGSITPAAVSWACTVNQ